MNKKYYLIAIVGLIAFLSLLYVISGGNTEEGQAPGEQSSETSGGYGGLGK